MSRRSQRSVPQLFVGSAESVRAAAVYTDWSNLLTRIRAGEADGVEELCRLFWKGLHYYLTQLLPDLPLDAVDDIVQDVCLRAFRAIHLGELTEPGRLPAFIRAALRNVEFRTRSQDRSIHPAPSGPRRKNQKAAAAFDRKLAFINEVMAGLSERDREILTRHYLNEESMDQICTEMGLTETQFRLLKSRAKARFAELEKRTFADSTEGRPESVDAPRDLGSHANHLRLEQILPVVAHAVAVFGDEKKASHWLATPLRLFGNQAPSQVLEQAEGVDLIEQVLTRIEHNIPT